MFFAKNKKIKFILYTGLIIAALLLFKNIAQTETQTENINVNMNVPTVGNHCTNGIQDADETGVDCGGADCGSCNIGCTGYCGPTPIITIVASSTGFNQATLSWTINPGSGYTVNTTSITYGKNFILAGTTAVTVSGTEFTAVMDNLEVDTIYNFEIYTINSGGGVAIKAGQIQTQEATILNNLTILAHPEKRVYKPEGNFGVDNATVFFLDQTASTILAEFTTVLEDDGSTTISNITVPEGIALVAVLKTNSHLGKRLNGINTTGGDLTLDFTESNSFYLFAGDMAGDLKGNVLNNSFAQFLQNAKQDEFVDILDISSVVSKFNNQQAGERANLNGDNIVDAQDISIVLSNWNKTGDMIGK